ncbi:MAG: helix-turn-helix domain-containing protein [Oscillospiraceae bacterium]|nr:helix-turn-helix domain-containing protein [Oscillospiraceae bacterium]
MANLSLSIGQIILELRKSKGSTQEELANAVGISPQAVSKWENGSTPDTELLPAIADYFNVPIDRLFGRTTHPNLSEAVNKYISEPGFFKGVDRALNIYAALHWGLAHSNVGEFYDHFITNDNVADHKWSEEGYSLMTSNGYCNLVTRKFWESINLDTASFARELFTLLAEPGMLEVLFAILRRKHDGPANFEMIKTALANADCSDEKIQECLDKLVKREIIISEDSPYDEIGKIYGFYPERGSGGHWYLGICALICAVQVLKMSMANRNFDGLGAWPIKL